MKYLFCLLLTVVSVAAHGQENVDAVAAAFASGPEAVAAFEQLPSATSATAVSNEEELSLLYNPAELPGAAGPAEEVGRVLERLKADLIVESEARSAGSAVIPTAPSSEELLSRIQDFSKEDLQQFLAKKQGFLTKISAWLQWLHLPVKLHNKILMTFNDQLYGSARVIARANAQGASVRLLAATGLGLNSLLAERLRGSVLGRWFPSSGGMFLMLGVGVSLTRLEVNGNKKWVLEVFADYSRLKSVKTFLASGSVGLNINYVAEFRQSTDLRVNDYEGSNKGPLGMVITGDGHFSYGPSLVLGFPPFAGAMMFYQIKQKRLSLLRLGVPSSSASVNSCSQIFSF